MTLASDEPRDLARRSPPPAATTTTPRACASDSCVVTLGTQHFYVIVDTGSSTFAIASSPEQGACMSYYQGSGCGGPPLSAQYGSGSWEGSVCRGPLINMNGLAAGAPAFGVRASG